VFRTGSGLALAFFCLGWWRRVRKYRKGRPAPAVASNPPRQGQTGGWRRPSRGRRLLSLASNETIRQQNRGVGAAHLLAFWGITILVLAHLFAIVDADIYPAITRALSSTTLAILEGVRGEVFTVLFNAAGLSVLVGVIYLAIRRLRARGPRLDYTRAQKPDGGYSRAEYVAGDWAFLALLGANPLIAFLMIGSEIRATGFPAGERWEWMPWLVGHGVAAIGIGPSSAMHLHDFLFWVHLAVGLSFIAYFPFSKATHMFTSAASLLATDKGPTFQLPVQAAMADHVGYAAIPDLTWKELLGLDACTKCGRCHEVCPVRSAGGPLSPRDLVLDLRQWVDKSSGNRTLLDWEHRRDATGPLAGRSAHEIAGEVIAEETLWACTTCMACVEVCPVGIVHVPTIVQLRRSLVERGDMEPSLQQALTNIGQLGNSFGKPSRMRARWTKDLGFEIKDAREEPVQHLWFVGDMASFDTQAQAGTKALARILHDAGVDFGILYHDEWNSGNDVRRVGEETLFEFLVERNLETFSRATFERVFTSDPHSLNTLRNEYGAYGFDHPVLHHTELLAELVESGAIPVRPLGVRVTYHDPCYLARYNRVMEAPRQILTAVGCELVEMPRNRENTFCCGAGGGRIWMSDTLLAERPSEQRIREAAALDVDRFVVSCPKDYVMFSDAVKTTGNEGRLRVSDVVQLVGEATIAG
jgi:Fe-S oxidoreductase/nitrate reductase gamma subunit